MLVLLDTDGVILVDTDIELDNDIVGVGRSFKKQLTSRPSNALLFGYSNL